MIPAASFIVSGGILSLSALVLVLFCIGVWRSTRSSRAGAIAMGVAVAWLLLVSAAALVGVLARFDARPPPYLLLMVGTLGLGAWAGLSVVGKRVAETTSLAVLVGVQAFRLPLELVMHRAYEEGVMPVQLSYSGYNFDIVTGAGAIVVAILLASKRAPRGLVALWNSVGLACLLMIAIVALTTSPLLRLFGEGPGNVNYWVAYFPYALLPAACVAFALAGHIVVLRRLRWERQVTR